MNGDRRPGTDRHDEACRRTRGLIDRIVAETLTTADREHASTCAQCGPVLARSARFDDALRRTARSIAVEELPRGILDPGLAGRPGGVQRGTALRGFQPGLAGVAAAVAILILTTGIALVPGGWFNPTTTPTPPAETGFTSTLPLFRTTTAIAGDMRVLKYECEPGGAVPTFGSRAGQPVREGIVCVTVKEDTTKKAALITGESGTGEVVRVTIKGELVGTDTLAATDVLATAFGKLAFVAIYDQQVAPVAGDWVDAKLRELRVLPAGDFTTTVLGEIRLTFHRGPSGDFMLLMEPFAPR